MDDSPAVVDPSSVHMSVSVEKITYGDDRGKYRVHFSSSRSEVYDDMSSAIRGMAQIGTPHAVTIGKSISFFRIDKARKVRTPDGAKRYGKPIGSPIGRGGSLGSRMGQIEAREKLAGGKPANSGLKARMDAAQKPKRKVQPVIDQARKDGRLSRGDMQERLRAARRARRGSGGGGPAKRSADGRVSGVPYPTKDNWRKSLVLAMRTNDPAIARKVVQIAEKNGWVDSKKANNLMAGIAHRQGGLK